MREARRGRRTLAAAVVLACAAAGTVVSAGGAGAALRPFRGTGTEPGAPSTTAPGTDDTDDETTGSEAPGTVSAEESERLADLVSGEDERLVDIKVAVTSLGVSAPKVPYRVRSAGGYTLVLTARRSPYTINDLRRLAPQTFVPLEDGSYLLREHLLVDAGATLSLAPQKATTIRLASSGRGFVSIVNDGGRLRLLGRASAPLTITSWDETLRRVDPQTADGRAYIRSRGQTVVRHATLKNLGFWSGRTGGLSISFPDRPQTGADIDVADTKERTTGSTSTNRLTTVLPTGGLPAEETSLEAVGAEVSDSLVEGNAFGLFVSAASGVKITNVTIRRSTVSGLVLHRSVTSAQVQQVRVEGSGLDGVVVTKGVEGTTLSQVEARGNRRDGIRLDGSPLASGPSASGQSMRSFGGNVVATSTVADNGRTGIRVVGGANVRVITNSVTGGPQGIVVDEGAGAVVVEGNRVGGAATNGIHVRGSAGVEVRGNAVDGSPTGLRLSDATAEIADNTVSGATLHAVTLVGAVAGTTVTDNRLSGSGTTAVDVVRAAQDADPVVEDNDLSGWEVTLTKDSLLSTVMHPMTLLWIGIGILMLLTLPLGKRRTGMPTPYPTGPSSPASIADIEDAQRRALEAAGVLAPVTTPAAAPAPQRERVLEPAGARRTAAPHRIASAPASAPAASPAASPAAGPAGGSPLHPDYVEAYYGTGDPPPPPRARHGRSRGRPDGYDEGHRVIDLTAVEPTVSAGELADWVRRLEAGR